MSPSLQHSIEQRYGYVMQSTHHPFRKRFPTTVGIVIGTLQMLLNGVIIGLEGGSVGYNPKIDIVYAGFWCSFSFFFTWVSMFAFLCFRKTFRWGLVVAGMNLISMVFAIILIVFDSLFIQNPCRCYLATVCDLETTSNFENINNCTGSGGKLRVVKAQLACTVTMLASNLGYIIIFIIIAILSRALFKQPTRSYGPTFRSMSSPQNASSKVSRTLSIYSPIDSPLHSSALYQSLYSHRYRQPVYPYQTIYPRASTPYYFQLDTF